MKHIIHALLFLTMLSCLLSCDENESSKQAVAPVSNITYVATNGAILFRWENPNIDNLAYVEITYVDKFGKTHRCLTKGGLNEQIVEGIGDNGQYVFRFLTYNKAGQCSEPVDIMATAMESMVNLFYGRVKLTVDFSGINVSWENEFSENFYIELTYKDLNGNHYEEEVVVAANSIGKQFVKIGASLSGTQSLDVYANIVDENGNISDSKVLKFYKKEAGRLSRTNWKVVSYSSQEGGSPVENLFDGDPKTTWHSRWSSKKADYPHWFVIDMGSKKRLEKIGIQQREKQQLLKGVRVYGNNVSGTPGDESQWTLIYEFEVVVSTAEQVLEFPDIAEFRYIRMYFTTPCGTDGGDNKCAGFAEMNLYGSDIADE